MTVTVIGGGAAGMMAALTAARGGHTVRLLEKQPRVGKKLLATGNGRCNITNMQASPAHYHGADAAFTGAVLRQLPVPETRAFFRTLGLVTVAEEDGKVYPYSDQAGSVVDVLRFAVEAAGIQVQTECAVLAVKAGKNGFTVKTQAETFFTEKLIVCCGGMAAPKLGGTQGGYTLLQSLGHTMAKLYPSLVQVKTDATYVRALKGVRADAAVTLLCGHKTLAQSMGEVQFTEYGISGPATFEISRAVSTAHEKTEVQLDLLRSMEEQEIVALLQQRCRQMPQLTLENLLTGVLHNRLGRTVLRYVGLELAMPVTQLSAAQIQSIAAACKCFCLPVLGTQGFESAQVTAGGIRTEEFDAATLQSRRVPGLYAAGEVLNVDGDCGGYNLQWAWSSGYVAGSLRG